MIIPFCSRGGTTVFNGQLLELSPTEESMIRVSKFLKGLMRVSLVLIFEGEVCTGTDLTETLLKLQQLHPILRSTVIPESDIVDVTTKLFIKVDDSIRLSVTTHDGSAFKDINEAWNSVWSGYVEKAPYVFGEALARFDVVYAHGATALVASCEHAFCDGRSFTNMCAELLRLMTHVDDVSSTISNAIWGPAFETACGPAESLSQERLSRRMAGFKQFPQPTNVKLFPSDSSTMNSFRLADTGSTRVQRVTFSAAESQRLLEACRSARTTITGALAAAILRASATVIRDFAVPMSSPAKDSSSDDSASQLAMSCGIDTRKLYDAPVGESVLSYHVSGLPLFLKSFEGVLNASTAELWIMASEYKKTITDAIACEYPLALSGFIGKIWAANLDEDAPPVPKRLSASLTNWGALPFTLGEYSPSIKLLAALPVVNNSNMVVPNFIASSVSNELSVTLLTHVPCVSSHHADALLAEFRKCLAAMIGLAA